MAAMSIKSGWSKKEQVETNSAGGAETKKG
jgi:hypothetical protein